MLLVLRRIGLRRIAARRCLEVAARDLAANVTTELVLVAWAAGPGERKYELLKLGKEAHYVRRHARR